MVRVFFSIGDCQYTKYSYGFKLRKEPVLYYND